MADLQPDTMGELRVILLRVERTVESMRTELVSAASFRAEQERTREEFADVRRDHSEWTAESRGAHVDLAAKIEAVAKELVAAQDKQRELERDTAKSKASRTLVIVGWVAAALLAIGGNLLTSALMGGG